MADLIQLNKVQYRNANIYIYMYVCVQYNVYVSIKFPKCILQNGKINLTLEIKLLTDEALYQKNHIRQLLVEKEKFEHDAEVANQQYYTALEVSYF
jgi:hypothetical protein